MRRIGLTLTLVLMALSTEGALADTPEASFNDLVVWSAWKDAPVKSDFLREALKGFGGRKGVRTGLRVMTRLELRQSLSFNVDPTEPDLTYVDLGFTSYRIVRSLTELPDFRPPEGMAQGWSLLRLEGLNGSTAEFVPVEGTSPVIYYNRRLFREAGIVPPADRPPTDREFLEMVRRLRRAGVTPIAADFSHDAESVGMPLLYTMFRYAGPEKMERLRQGRITFADPDVFAALRFWKQVLDAEGYGVRWMERPEPGNGIGEVLEGRAAMCLGGSATYGGFAEAERELDQREIGVMDWFSATDGKGNDVYEVEWVGGFAINRKSIRRRLALDFLEYLLTVEMAARWGLELQAAYPLAGREPRPGSLAADLVRQRAGQRPFLGFSHRMFQTLPVRMAWEDSVPRFLTGEHSVDKFIQRMNSRLLR